MPIPDQPINIFAGNAIETTDPVTGVVTWTGDYVQFFRKSGEPFPRSLVEAKALLRKQIGKDATLVALIDKDRPGKDESTAVAEAVKEIAAHAKGATWKAAVKYADVKGGSVVIRQGPVTVVKGDPVVVEVDPAPKEPVK